MTVPKIKAVKVRKAAKPIKVSPLNDIVMAAMFTDAKSSGLTSKPRRRPERILKGELVPL
jgi:hypothetical protein